VILLIFFCPLPGCLHYSFTGAATAAKTIQVDQFYNNTDLAPANIAQTFTNLVKDYFQQNSSLRVVQEGGELQMDGTITGYTLTPLAAVPSTTTAGAAPTTSTSANPTTSASQQTYTASITRVTITIKVNYVDNNEPKNSFKDKTFSFYQDFDNATNPDYSAIQDGLETKIYNQILIDIFNATVANW
jgi:hypothetical protein